MTNPKEALEWYERKRVEARAMADRDCKSCKHNKPDGCSRWECEYEPVMSDLINRQDAINCCSCLHPEECWDEIRKLPSAVEVVRCKDCKFLYKDGECPLRTWFTHTEDDYCSYGERREDGEA